jgi:hypothetical protein
LSTSVISVVSTSGSAIWVSWEDTGMRNCGGDVVNDTETFCLRLVEIAYHPYDE